MNGSTSLPSPPGRRILGYLIDVGVVCAFFSLILAILDIDRTRPFPLWVWVAGAAVGLGYFTLGNYRHATLGQLLVGVRVEAAGANLSLGRAFLRAAVTIGLGPFTAVFARDPDYRTAGDRAARTRVVRLGRS